MKLSIIAAVSLAGFIATSDSDKLEWVSAEDRQWFRQATTEAGVVIMGHTTHSIIGRILPDRLNVVYSRSHPESRTSSIYWTQKQPKDLVHELSATHDSAYVIGGSEIYSLFLESGLVDELWITQCPAVLGSGLTITNAPATLRLMSSTPRINGEVLLRYKVL